MTDNVYICGRCFLNVMLLLSVEIIKCYAEKFVPSKIWRKNDNTYIVETVYWSHICDKMNVFLVK